MAYVYNTVYNFDTFPGGTTFIPYCNAPVSVDYQARHFQEVYYAPEPAPQIQFIRQRLPDPPPDVIDRVVIVPQPKQYIYQVVEVPTKPPPVVRQRVVHQSPNSPVCAGTYHVPVSHNSSSSSTGLAHSSSTIQSSPSFTQASHIQQAPMMMSSPPIISI